MISVSRLLLSYSARSGHLQRQAANLSLTTCYATKGRWTSEYDKDDRNNTQQESTFFEDERRKKGSWTKRNFENGRGTSRKNRDEELKIQPKDEPGKILSRRSRQRIKHKELTEDPKNWDTFGTLGPQERLESEYLPDDDDGYDVLEKRKRRRPLDYYTQQFRNLLYQGGPDRMRRAVVLFEQMQTEDRHDPLKNHFTMLITGCARFGLVSQAFTLFEKSLQIYKRPTQATITSLFNACAESRDKTLALEKADYLRNYLEEISFVPNMFQYNAMIKAYGRQGEMKTAFQIVKEMVKNKVSPGSATYAMLLQGCASDKEAGLTHAIRILRQMQRRSIPFDVHTFNLFLRSVRDCGVGSREHLKYLFHDWSEADIRKAFDGNSTPQLKPTSQRFFGAGEENMPEYVAGNIEGEETTPARINPVRTPTALPNLLKSITPEQVRDLVSFDIESLNDRVNRLYLVGGMEGILELMDKNKVQPKASTATLLLDSIPDNMESEVTLVEEMKKRDVWFDTDFFNMLIKKRNFRHDLTAAKNTIVEMQAHSLFPDIVTFGCLATGCYKCDDGMSLLADMENAGFKPNIEIVGALVRQAAFKSDFHYLLKLLKYMERNHIEPQPRNLETIMLANLKADAILLKQERGNLSEYPPFTNDGFSQQYDIYKLFLKGWLKRMKVDVPEDFAKQFEFDFNPSPKEKFNQFEAEMKQKLEDRLAREQEAARQEGQ